MLFGWTKYCDKKAIVKKYNVLFMGENEVAEISIIIPVYNAELYLDRCVNSIINQTFTDWELILVDDGSVDNSLEKCKVLEKKDTRIKVVHKSNGGAGSARNVGLKIASGKYVGFVDSDDWIAPNMYKRLYQVLKQNNADMSICEIKEMREETKYVNDSKPQIEVWNQRDALERFFRIKGGKSIFSICRRLISREILNGYSFIEGKMNEDIETSYHLAANCKRTVYTNEALYFYYKNDSGVTHSKFNYKKLDLLYIWDYIVEDIRNNRMEYLQAALFNKKRANFTLLSHMALFGYEHNDKKMRNLKRQLQKEVRKDFWELLKSKMSFGRKVLLFYVSLF